MTAENKALAQKKIDSNPSLLKLHAVSDSLKNYVEKDDEIPLELMPFFAYNKKKDAFNERLDDMQNKEKPSFKVGNTAFHEKMLSMNAVEQQMNQDLLEILEKDLILQETVSVFRDFYTFGR